MIVGTAGHIDHGKTTLVRALTGVDTDRLPEEKKRGITIELGYAYLDVPDAGSSSAAGAGAGHGQNRIGFIDVPGHERLVHTMLAGATGIDLALLLVAADDGVMPQTREHLAVLSLLGLIRGAIVITKADRADAARVAAVCDEARALQRDTSLAGAPLFIVSALSGAGLPALKAWLMAQAVTPSIARAQGSAYRLAIDRAFTLDGVGTVVTGTAHAGRVAVGDELQLVPAAQTTRARVRSLHAQNRVVNQAEAGQRAALALAGLAKDSVARGQWLVAPEVALATDRIDVRLTLWHGESKPLRSGTPVHVHLGAGDTMATVAALDAGAESLRPGVPMFAQLVLHRTLAAWHGDRVVLRDASASRTLAGGVVLDPFAPTRYRRTPERLAALNAWGQASATARINGLLSASKEGVDLRRWQRAEGLASSALPALPAATLRGAGDGQTDWALAAEHALAASAAALQSLRDYHQRQSEELGPDAARLRRLAAPRLPEPLWRALLAQLLACGQLAQRGAFVHLPEHGIKLSATEERIAQKVATLLEGAGYEGAWVRDLARDTQESEALMRTTLARLAQRGELHQVVRDLFYPQATIARLAQITRDAAQAEANADAGSKPQRVTAAGFRDATKLGRKRAIQVLEYFDRVGLLRRVGDEHRLRSDTDLFRSAA